jgi:general stress protein 26
LVSRMKVDSFSEIEQEFIEKVHKIVWCNVTTIDTKGRPRSRVLHPIWEGSTGWIATGRTSLKAKHLAQNPYVSLAYIQDPLKPVYAECTAEWVDDTAEKQRIWDLFCNTPPPLGYDMARFFGSLDSPNYGLLKLTPWHIEMSSLFEGKSVIWEK